MYAESQEDNTYGLMSSILEDPRSSQTQPAPSSHEKQLESLEGQLEHSSENNSNFNDAVDDVGYRGLDIDDDGTSLEQTISRSEQSNKQGESGLNRPKELDLESALTTDTSFCIQEKQPSNRADENPFAASDVLINHLFDGGTDSSANQRTGYSIDDATSNASNHHESYVRNDATDVKTHVTSDDAMMSSQEVVESEGGNENHESSVTVDGNETDEDDEIPEIPAELRNRSPNIANLLQRRHSLGRSSPTKMIFSNANDDNENRRSSASNTSVGVFINGKLSGHSDQRSILTSHYLAINSLGVLSRFHYRLRVTEVPDCVAALANGEIIVADNHSDVRRLKMFDCNQRYQRALPLVSEEHTFPNEPFVTDIQLSNNDCHLWVVDSFNQTVREVDLTSGSTLQLWTNERLERGHELIRPGKLAVSPEWVYVCDAGDETVKTFDRFNGQFLFKFKIGTNDQDKRGPISNHAESSRESITYNDDDCGCPWSIHWTMDETLLVGDIRHDFVYIVDKRGQKLGCFGGSGWGPNRFNGPVAICSDGDGNVAIADSKNGRVQMFTRDMMLITHIFPVEEGDDVTSIALTADGMLAVIDHHTNQCLIF